MQRLPISDAGGGRVRQPLDPAPPSGYATGSLAFEGLRQLAETAPLRLIVRGSCMAPRWQDGERVLIDRRRRYWPGDVVAFRTTDGRLLLHRLLGYRLERGRVALVTRGDGCPCHDAPVPCDSILGRTLEPVPVAARLRALASYLRLALRRLLRG